MAGVNSGSTHTQAAQNAKALGGFFNSSGLFAGSVTLTTIQTTASVAHGLSTTPDFVIATATAVGAISSWVTAAVTATTVTVSTGNTLESKVISILAGDLA
jgi:hypothetical protein